MFDSDSPTSNASTSPLRTLWVVAAVITHRGQIFAAQRKAGGSAGLKWEFPGGKVEAGETAHNALRREIREELSIDTAIGECLGTYFTPSDGYLIRLQCYWCSVASREVNLSSHVKSGWFSEDELMRLDWALPDVPAVEAIVQRDLSRP